MTQIAAIAVLVASLLVGIARAQTPPAQQPAAPQQPPPSSVPPDPEAAAELELASQPVSNAARIRLERARDSVVQIRGFFRESRSDAFHGTGFAASADGLIVTNYHVVSDAILYPKQYRLEYLTPDGRSGPLQIYAIDVEHDLAVVKSSDNFKPPPLKSRVQIPNKGERAYSIGFPLDLGLTITEGVANGLVENTLEQRIHYSGAMNGGMSGGPALDSSGAVYGVNVSVFSGRQSVSFVVPAKHIAPLLARATHPLKPGTARELVASQLLLHQNAVFASIPQELATQTSSGYVLPAKIASSVECNSDGNADPSKPVRLEAISCGARVGVFVERDLDVGDFRFQHRILESDKLTPLQFSERVNRIAAARILSGSRNHVAAFTCDDALVALNGFDARVTTCVRQYRMFASLYDFAITIVSVNQPRRAVVSNLELRGVAFQPGMDFLRQFLGAMQWNP
jgi:serine protease Do